MATAVPIADVIEDVLAQLAERVRTECEPGVDHTNVAWPKALVQEPFTVEFRIDINSDSGETVTIATDGLTKELRGRL